MYSRLTGWLGPVIVEWTPDEPGLADARRRRSWPPCREQAGPIIPERVVIGPSPYPGRHGQSRLVNNFNNIVDPRASRRLSLSAARLSRPAATGSSRDRNEDQ